MSQCQVRDILSSIAPNVSDAGVCIDSAEGKQEAIQALDLGLDALMKRIDSEGTLWYWTVPTTSGCFGLPEDCLEARQMFVNGASAIQRDMWFQGRLAYGLRDCGVQCAPEVRDMGSFVLPMPIPNLRPIRIALVGQLDSDAGKEVVVEVINEYGERVTETLTLLTGQRAVRMESPATDVTYLGKPRTDGPVKLYFSYDNGHRYYVCEYGPMTRSGQYRRKRLPQRFCGCNEVRIVGKRRYYPITSENDIIPICDRIALSFAVSAIADLRRKDHEGYNANMTFALNELHKGMENSDSAGNVTPVQFMSGMCGNPSWAAGWRNWA